MSDPAALRFFAIQAVRLGGVAMAVLALLILSGRTPWPTAAPGWAGAILLLVGLLCALLAPRLLARRWRSGK